ncbi:V-type proton ATPase subunit C 1-like isoform X1 [Aotus nancymaae]|uniref:V-type proton ATPase subunit C 1-like isoform X1 n=1 Tax=Aotus nancymaae TaxID=37293 RepID=UPI0030FE2843
MTEFWLISAPGEKTCQQTWEKLHAATSKNNNLAVSSKFNIPDLKVGTLDVLVGLSDELAKLDAFVEGVVKKVAQYMADVLEDSKDKVQENLLANGVDLVTYITRFQWDMAKYPIKQSLKNISEIIAKGVTQIDNDLKSRTSAYNNLKGNLQNLERKNAGSLLTRSLAEIVKKDDFVLDSEYLVTLLVVVPKLNHNDWIKQYETLAEMVVPRSSKTLHTVPCTQTSSDFLTTGIKVYFTSSFILEPEGPVALKMRQLPWCSAYSEVRHSKLKKPWLLDILGHLSRTLSPHQDCHTLTRKGVSLQTWASKLGHS